MWLKVLHTINTTRDSSVNYHYKTWIEYWNSNTSTPLPLECPFCKRNFTKDNYVVGAHVVTTNNWKTYIVPCCNRCNLKYSKKQEGTLKVFDISEQLLVSHPST